MAKRDYYDVLGIAKGANADEIKKAYLAAFIINNFGRQVLLDALRNERGMEVIRCSLFIHTMP